MDYFILGNDLREETVGEAYPQVECETMFQAHVLTSWKHFELHPKLRFRLNKKAVLTDFLNQIPISSNGFLVNDKVKNILKNFRLMDHQWFETVVKVKRASIPYYWLHLSQVNLVKTLDYKNTVFFRTDFTFREEQIQLASFEEYQKLKSQDKEARFGVEIEKVALSEKFDLSLDMFTFLPFDRCVYVSERLKEALEESCISGITLTPTDRFK